MSFILKNGRFCRQDQHLVHWVHVKKRGGEAKGIIFAPPLIGASFSYEIKNLKILVKKGYELFSFNYTGHGKSSDKFRLKATLEDTTHILDFLVRRAGSKPVYAVASCYSAIPLIHAAHKLGEPIEKMVLINALCHINPRAIIKSFISYYKNAFSGTISTEKIHIAFQEYIAFLFPGIKINRDFFGSLLRQRADTLRTLWDVLFLDPLKSVRLQRTPVLGLYAKQDRILKIYDDHVGQDYEKQILARCPDTMFYPLPCDHFLTSRQSREVAYRKILAFFDTKTVRYGCPSAARTSVMS